MDTMIILFNPFLEQRIEMVAILVIEKHRLSCITA
jgi:hypothetical protein